MKSSLRIYFFRKHEKTAVKNRLSIFLKIFRISSAIFLISTMNQLYAQNALPSLTGPTPPPPGVVQAPIPTSLQPIATDILSAATAPPQQQVPIQGVTIQQTQTQQPPAQPAPAQQVPSQQASSQLPLTASQFEQWLKTNGYGQTGAPQVAGTVPPSGRRPALRPPIPGTSQRLPTHIAMPGSTGVRRPPSRRPHRPPCGPLTYEQSLRAMLNSMPQDSPAPSEEAQIAFNNMLQQNMPLSPRQVVKLHQQIDKAQRAAAVSPTIPPKPVSSTLMINLAPGTTPPVVRLAQGYVSSLVFVDSTGSPWPIASFDIGNPKSMNIQWDGKSNILLLQAVLPYSDGNIVIRLAGLPTPITLELVAGQRVVDYRVDIHVSGIGPNTKEIPIGTSLPDSANQLLLGVLDGVAPPGSKLLTVLGAHSDAWLLGDRLYLRTRFTVLSPGWTGKMSSVDGMNAYELPRTSSVLISRYGEPVEIKIEGL